MPLTTAQIAFEKDWVARWFAAGKQKDVDAWISFYKEWTYVMAGRPALKGVHIIRKWLAHELNIASSYITENMTVIVDEEHSRLIIVYDATLVLAADPEKKEIKLRPVVIVSKALGVNEEQMSKEEVISDPTPVIARINEAGIDGASLALVE